MEIEYGREFQTWLDNIRGLRDKDDENRTRLELAAALLSVLRDLEVPPMADTAGRDDSGRGAGRRRQGTNRRPLVQLGGTSGGSGHRPVEA